MKANKQWKLTGCLFLSIIGLSSCVQSQLSDILVDSKEISISADIAEAKTRMSGSSFDNGDGIGIYVIEYPGTENSVPDWSNISSITYSNTKRTYTGASWTGDAMYWQSEKKVDMIAYYPYDQSQTNISESYSWTISSEQETKEKLLR